MKLKNLSTHTPEEVTDSSVLIAKHDESHVVLYGLLDEDVSLQDIDNAIDMLVSELEDYEGEPWSSGEDEVGWILPVEDWEADVDDFLADHGEVESIILSLHGIASD